MPRPLQGLLQTQFGLLFRLVARVSLAVLQQGMVADLTGKIRDRLPFFRLAPGGTGLARGFRGGLVRRPFTGRGGRRRGVLPLPAVMLLPAGALFPGPASGGLLLRAAVQGRVLQGGQAGIDLVHAEPRVFGMFQMALRQPEAGIEQQGIHHHIAGLVPEPGIASAAPDMVGAGQMHDLVGLGPHQPFMGQGGRPGGVEAQRAAVGPEVAAGAVRFQVQMQDQGAEKGLPEHQCRPGPDHGREGAPLQGRKIVPVHIRTSALSRAQRAKGSLSTTAGSWRTASRMSSTPNSAGRRPA